MVKFDVNRKFNLAAESWRKRNSLEGEIEVEFYSYLLEEMRNIKLHGEAPEVNYLKLFAIDGIIDLKTYTHDNRILIEAKCNIDFSNPSPF